MYDCHYHQHYEYHYHHNYLYLYLYQYTIRRPFIPGTRYPQCLSLSAFLSVSVCLFLSKIKKKLYRTEKRATALGHRGYESVGMWISENHNVYR